VRTIVGIGSHWQENRQKQIAPQVLTLGPANRWRVWVNGWVIGSRWINIMTTIIKKKEDSAVRLESFVVYFL
jgi:hypothetical protein